MKSGMVLVGVIWCVAGVASIHAQSLGSPDSVSPRTNYLERCGGCHGINGHSASILVPDLKDRAGYFLCNDSSRSYAARLPNVVFSQVNDADLAGLLNYVMFDLGGASAPPDAHRYTGSELSAFRKHPLTTTDLLTYRRKVVSNLVKNCGAPSALLTEYRPKTRAP